MARKKKVKLPVEVGKRYHFFDDGKTSPSRHYIATVDEVITPDEAKNRYLEDYRDGVIRPLYDIWKEEVNGSSHLYAPETDFFIRCSIPKYDEYPIWFVKTKDGEYFSIDVQSGWQSGRLDIGHSIYDTVKEYFDTRHYPGYYDEESHTEKID